jgi:hypothetical protein
LVKNVTAAATIIKNPGAISFPVRATSHDTTSGVSPPITPKDMLPHALAGSIAAR